MNHVFVNDLFYSWRNIHNEGKSKHLSDNNKLSNLFFVDKAAICVILIFVWKVIANIFYQHLWDDSVPVSSFNFKISVCIKLNTGKTADHYQYERRSLLTFDRFGVSWQTTDGNEFHNLMLPVQRYKLRSNLVVAWQCTNSMPQFRQFNKLMHYRGENNPWKYV